jgi:hypothetical protein
MTGAYAMDMRVVFPRQPVVVNISTASETPLGLPKNSQPSRQTSCAKGAGTDGNQHEHGRNGKLL